MKTTESKNKQSLVNSATVLKNNYSYDMSMVYKKRPDVIVDKEELLEDFYELLYMNLLDYKPYKKIKESLPVKILVYKDRFYIAGRNDVWSQPFFFCYEEGTGELLYFNSADTSVYYYDDSNQRIEASVNDFGITPEQKDQFIIDKINMYAEVYSKENGIGINIKIKNPNNLNMDYKVPMESYNILEGVTFLLIYSDYSNLQSDNELYSIHDYDVIGYTLKY